MVILSAAIRIIFTPYLDPELSFVLFYPVVVFCTWFAGAAFGVLSTLLSILSLIAFYNYHPQTSPGEAVFSLIAFAIEGVLISVLLARIFDRLHSEHIRQLGYMRAFIDDAPAAIAMFDREMRYIAASRRWISDFHLNGRRIIGESHYTVFPEIPECWRAVHQRCLAGSVERADEDLFVRADGSRQWLAWEVRPWRLAAGDRVAEIGGIIIFSEDITNLKQSHEREIGLRSARQVEEALRLEAERSTKNKDLFLGTVSHELRTPLNALLSWNQLLKRSLMSAPGVPLDRDKVSQASEAIEFSGRALAQLISEILDINRIASGKLRLNLEKVDIIKILDRVVTSLKPLARQKGITLKRLEQTDTDKLPQSIVCDSARIQQSLVNLISNAIKFTPTGGSVTLEVNVIERDLSLSVRDTGRGIAPQALLTIFERFSQVAPESGRLHGGLGLGLSIVRDLVELHGGTVSADSQGIGLGSCFTIKIPLREELRLKPENLDKVSGPRLDLEGVSVLLIEMDCSLREVICDALESNYATVYSSATLDRGLQVAKTVRPGVLVVEVKANQTPESLSEVIKSIRDIGLSSPVWALGDRVISKDAESSILERGFAAYIPKCLNHADLLSSLLLELGGGSSLVSAPKIGLIKSPSS